MHPDKADANASGQIRAVPVGRKVLLVFLVTKLTGLEAELWAMRLTTYPTFITAEQRASKSTSQ